MTTKSLVLTLVLLALGGGLSAQTLTPAGSSTGSITTNAANCNTTNACIILHLATSNVGYSVTVSGTWTGTLTVEQSGDNQGSWTSATTTTANTLFTSALTPGITDVRVRGSAAMTGTAVVTITASGPATLQQITQTGSSSSSPSSQNLGLNVIDPSFPSSGTAVKADTQSVSDATITNGSSTVTTGVNDACFVSATDNGKKMMGTNWNGSDLTYPTAVIALGASGATAQGTILVVNSCHSVGVSTTGNASATGAANNTFVYGHDDTAAVQNAYTISAATALCEPIRFPGGMMWIEDVVGTNVTVNCSNTQANVAHQTQYSGWGKYATTFFIAPNFYANNTGHCTGGPSSNGCFFSGNGGQGVSLVDMSFWSAGYGNTPTVTTYSLISLGIDSQLINVQLSGMAANPGGGAPTCVTMNSNYVLNIIIDGCGKTGLNATSEFISDIFIGDMASVSDALLCFTLCVSNGGNYHGVNAPAVIVENGGTFKSWGEAFVCDGANVTNAIQLGTANSTTRTDLIDAVVLCNANTGSAGVTMFDNTSAYVLNSQITAGATGQPFLKVNANSTAAVYNQGGNTFTPVPSGTSSPFPSCAVATALAGVGSTCTPDAGSLNERGTLTITAAGTPAAAGPLTLTFSGTVKGATALGPSCSFTFNNGGTAWNARVSGILGTQSTTSSILNIDNNAVNLVAASTYKVSYSCPTSY